MHIFTNKARGEIVRTRLANAALAQAAYTHIDNSTWVVKKILQTVSGS